MRVSSFLPSALSLTIAAVLLQPVAFAAQQSVTLNLSDVKLVNNTELSADEQGANTKAPNAETVKANALHPQANASSSDKGDASTDSNHSRAISADSKHAGAKPSLSEQALSKDATEQVDEGALDIPDDEVISQKVEELSKELAQLSKELEQTSEKTEVAPHQSLQPSAQEILDKAKANQAIGLNNPLTEGKAASNNLGEKAVGTNGVDSKQERVNTANNGSLVNDDALKSRRYKDPFVAPANYDAEKHAKDRQNAVKAIDSSKKAVVIYFSQPENINSENVDILTGASVVLNKNIQYGTVEFIAMQISEQLNIASVRLLNNEPYPHTHDELVERVSEEQDSKARPEISISPSIDLNDYDTVFIGFPIWWDDFPMPIYSFFEQMDLSGKTIVPFCAYSLERPSKLLRRIAKLEPNANVITDGLMIERTRVHQGLSERVKKWLRKKNILKAEVKTTRAAQTLAS